MPAAPNQQDPPPAVWKTDELGEQWLPRPGGPLPRLSPRLETIAITGAFNSRQYDSPSEARQAVISGAVACGWQLSDVTRRLSGD
ncbi:hypothetical protein FHR32_007227 [Streptosporangium album]|uniref:Uncharacterized protein n=1 Tax=Streptosporangium album TaxID=47479 RepID=A0A7W7S362_9ACTN|nr:hypothetical protein [Streptosporangium album]MBB4942827.1 hypothetical protein [Streptosporangium album]